jgi:hypothetical protein
MKKHDWKWTTTPHVLFATRCKVCGARDHTRWHLDADEEIKRIESRTDCDVMFAKRAAVRMTK